MTGRVSVRFLVVLWPPLAVFQPLPCAVRMHVVFMIRNELLSLGPERCDALGAVVEIDVEAVGLVVVLHPAEDVVVDIAEEIHVWLDAPVVLHVLEGGVLGKETRVPAAHLVVGDFVHVLHFLFSQEGHGFSEQIHVDPGGDFPVLLGDFLC